VRIELDNQSGVPLRWGGCAAISLLTSTGETADHTICSLALIEGDDRPILGPGERETIDWEFTACLRPGCALVGTVTLLEGEYRVWAAYSAERPADVDEAAGPRSGQSTSNLFTLQLPD
jgi:hypothetical protein